MTERRGNTITRRGAIGAALVGVGGLCGWAVQRVRRSPAGPKTPLDRAGAGPNPYAYDLSEFERTDPDTLLFEPAGEFDPGFETVIRIAVGADDELIVAGDKEVRFFDTSGELIRSLTLSQVPHCLHVSDRGELFIGYARHFDVHDLGGERQHGTEYFSRSSFLTSIATAGDSVFVADAGNREVIVCDREGNVERRFGKVGEDESNPGFAVPSPYFDLTVDSQGKLRIANPGRLRVETYTSDGRFESSWGEPGMGIDRFSGCCNPSYLAMTGDGGFITSEKGLARIKVYDAQGEFRGVVAGPDFLVDDKKLAKQAGNRGGVGAGFDVAVTDQGWVHALDPFRKTVRSFRPLA